MISSELIKGGLDFVDKKHKTIISTKEKENVCLQCIGNDVDDNIKNFIISWRVFCKYHSPGDSNYTIELNDCMNTILRTSHTLNADEWCEIVHRLVNLSPQDFSKFINKVLGASDKLKNITKLLFTTWRLMIETFFIEFLKLRNELIVKKNKAAQKKGDLAKNDLGDLKKKWAHANTRFSIDTSSHIIYFSTANGYKYKLAPHILTGHTETKILFDKLNKYSYLGFCIKKPLFRLSKLLEFPLSELFGAIIAIEEELEHKKTIVPDLSDLQNILDRYKSNQSDQFIQSNQITQHDPADKRHAFAELKTMSTDKLYENMELLIKKLMSAKNNTKNEELAHIPIIKLFNEINNIILSYI